MFYSLVGIPPDVLARKTCVCFSVWKTHIRGRDLDAADVVLNDSFIIAGRLDEQSLNPVSDCIGGTRSES